MASAAANPASGGTSTAALPEEDVLKAVCVPVKLDAFVFNAAVCDGASRVAPLSKPEYGNFASDSATPRHDVVPPLDLSLSSPGSINPRLTDLLTGNVKKERFGIYLSWCIPKPFRMGYAATKSGASRSKETNEPILPKSDSDAQSDSTSPRFVAVPNRWIIVRQLSALGSADKPNTNTRVFVVDSDLTRSGDFFSVYEDVENEVTPFLDRSKPLSEQGNCFLGCTRKDADLKTPVDSKAKRHSPLTILSSSNPLFADYQPHHSGVFSVHDDMTDVGSATVSYFLMGYYAPVSSSILPQDPLTGFGKAGELVTDKALLSTFRMQLATSKSKEIHAEDVRNAALCQWKKASTGPPQAFTVCHGALYDVVYSEDQAPKVWPAELAMTALQESSPISVGTTSIDALVAQMRAAADHLPPGERQRAAFALIRKLECYLTRPSEDVDSQLEAADLIDTNNFQPSKTAKTWHIPAKKETPARGRQADPDDKELKALADVNLGQGLLNQLDRERSHLQHLLFCTYWKALSLTAHSVADDWRKGIKASVDALSSRIMQINLTINTRAPDIITKAQASGFESSVAPSFYTQKDPVVAFAGLPTGWPIDWEEDVNVRFRRMSRDVAKRAFVYQYDEKDKSMCIDALDKVGAFHGAFDQALAAGSNMIFSEVVLFNLYSMENENDYFSTESGVPLKTAWKVPYYDHYDGNSAQESITAKAHLYLVPQYNQFAPPDWRSLPGSLKALFPAAASVIQRLQLGGAPASLSSDRMKDVVTQVHNQRQVWAATFSANAHFPVDPIAGYDIFVARVQSRGADKFGNFGMEWLKAAEPMTDSLDLSDLADPWDLSKRLSLFKHNDQIGQTLDCALEEATPEIKHVFKDLFLEWMCLHTMQDFGRTPPHYYMHHDRWLAQAFFPVFVEWELEYYHIPYTSWTFGPSGKEKRVRYSIRSDVNLASDAQSKLDVHIISGRSFVLPNVASQIKTMAQRFIDTINPKDLDPSIQIDELWKLLSDMPFMSSAMNGFNDHLATLQTGNHIKPFQRQQGQRSFPVVDSHAVVAELGFSPEIMALLGTQTARTPFAELNGGPFTEFSSFKPVTHGQARFTKLSIVDKFGQVVPCLDPAHRPPDRPVKSIDPITSEYFFCEPIGPDDQGHFRPNTVITQDIGRCEFFQIPPRINQDARWNGDHLVPNSSDFRPCNDWENPIVCIIVINYMDKSLQIFAADGEFAAEYTIGGIEGASGVRLRPFTPKAAADPRMAAFMKLLAQRDYLFEVYSMVEHGTSNLPHVPGSYADALPAVLGRPVALTYAGWSLELATPPFATHAFSDARKQVQSVVDYEFPLKLGDKDAAYDGLIGFFPVPRSSSPDAAMSKIKTHFAAMTNSKYLEPASDSCSAMFRPYYVQADASSSPDSIAREHNTARSIFGMFVDVFTPVMGYSGILPVKQLHLPAWTLERALKRMTGFYAVGPMIVPDEVLPLRKNPAPAPGVKLDLSEPEMRTVQMPHDPANELSWLQPSWGHGPQTEGYTAGAGADGRTFYEVMGLGALDTLLGERKGPLSAAEGYLQLKKKDMAAPQA